MQRRDVPTLKKSTGFVGLMTWICSCFNSCVCPSAQMELEDTASSSNDQKIDYNKNIIEKILYVCTNKNIEVFLSYSNKQKQGTTHNSVTDELIEQIQLYLSEKKEDIKYLVLYLNTGELVNIAYLGHLHYSDVYQNWKLDIIPLVNYKKIKQIELDIERNLDAIDVGIPGAKIYNDLNIIGKHVAQVIEYAKLRIVYLKLNKTNFQQYKLEFDSIELSKSSISEAHKKILEQSSNDNNKYLEVVELDTSEVSNSTLCLFGKSEDYDL